MGLFGKSRDLTPDQLRRISLSAQYQYQQQGEHFTLSTELGQRAKAILQQGWGIADEDDLQDMVESLMLRNHSLHIAICKEEIAAEMQEGSEINTGVRRMGSMAAIADRLGVEDVAELMTGFDMLRNLINAQAALAENRLLSSWEVLTATDMMGWDLGRAAYLVRLGVETKLITDEQAWEQLDAIYRLAAEHFSTWEEFGRSYIIGRSLWADDEEQRDVSGFCNAMQWLLKHPQSPWVKVTFK